MTVTDSQHEDLRRRLGRDEILIRQLQGSGGGGATYPPGGDPGEVLGYVGPGQNDVAWVSPSGAADLHYTHTQGLPNTIWNVVHNLGKFPAISVVDTGGSIVLPNVTYIDVNTVQLTFGSATTGKAYVN